MLTKHNIPVTPAFCRMRGFFKISELQVKENACFFLKKKSRKVCAFSLDDDPPIPIGVFFHCEN